MTNCDNEKLSTTWRVRKTLTTFSQLITKYKTIQRNNDIVTKQQTTSSEWNIATKQVMFHSLRRVEQCCKIRIVPLDRERRRFEFDDDWLGEISVDRQK